MQNAYRGKIKMIYIDPPYNTGNDFVYNDTFAESALEASSQPLGVSAYELSSLIPEEYRGSMPTIEEIEQELGK